MRRFNLVISLFVASLANGLGAQTLVYSTTNTAFETVPDVSGDGIPDFRTTDASGAVSFVSGYNFVGIPLPTGMGVALNSPHLLTAVGDLDGDQTADVIRMSVVQNASNYDLILTGFSFVSGQTIFSAVFAQSAVNTDLYRVRLLGDVNGDGVRDFALTRNPVGSSANGIFFQDGFWRVHSGATRALLLSEVVPALSSTGPAVEGNVVDCGPLGDVDGDGHADFWTRLRMTHLLPYFLNLRHGAGGGTFFSVNSSYIGVLALGDANQDGKDDILYFDTGGPGSPVSPPTVGVLRGDDLEVLMTFPGSLTPTMRVETCADVDHDGCRNIVVHGKQSSAVTAPNQVVVRSSGNGAVLLTMPITTSDVGRSEDVNLDGTGEILVRNVASSLAEWRLYSFRSNHQPATSTPFGQSNYLASHYPPTIALECTPPVFGSVAVISVTAPASPGYGVLMVSTPVAEPLTVLGGAQYDVPSAIWVDLSSVSAMGIDTTLSPFWSVSSYVPIIPIAEGGTLTLQAAFWPYPNGYAPFAGGFFVTNPVNISLGY